MGRVLTSKAAQEYSPQPQETLAQILAREALNPDQLSWQEVALFNWGSADPKQVGRALQVEIGCDAPCPEPETTPLLPARGPETPGKIKIPRLWRQEEMPEAGASVELALQAPPTPKPMLTVQLVRAVEPDIGKGLADIKVKVGELPEQTSGEPAGEVRFDPIEAGEHTVHLSLIDQKSKGLVKLPDPAPKVTVVSRYDPPLRLELAPLSLLRVTVNEAGEGGQALENVIVRLTPGDLEKKTEGPEKQAVFDENLTPGKVRVCLVIPGEPATTIEEAAEVECLPYASQDLALSLPSCTLDKKELDFGRVDLKADKELEITVKNSGGLPLKIAKVERKDGAEGCFEAVVPPAAIAAGEQAALKIKFKPQELGTQEATFELLCNDPKTPKHELKLKAVGQYPIKLPGSDGGKRVHAIIKAIWAGGTPSDVRNEAAATAVPPPSLKQALKKGPEAVLRLLCGNGQVATVDTDSDNWGSGGSHPYEATDGAVTAYFKGLFADTQRVNTDIQLEPNDLFHGHVFYCGPDDDTGPQEGELGILFHAKEYPHDTQGFKYNLGVAFSRQFNATDNEYQDRNILYLMSANKMWALRAQGANLPVLKGFEDFAMMKQFLPQSDWAANDPANVNAMADDHFYAVGAKMPDVNYLPKKVKTSLADMTLFFKSYQAV